MPLSLGCMPADGRDSQTGTMDRHHGEIRSIRMIRTVSARVSTA